MPNNKKKNEEEVHIYKFTNQLINETSPYLQAHAHNPVKWYPWGEMALNKAKKENKLIFLSIGYHACHWCHVMEKESFEDLEVAKYLNENFVCIKVDREERKDLDAIYMKACQLITGTGGWPLNLWLTPDKLPVYAGTYFTKHTYMDRPGIIEVSDYLSKVYADTPNKIINQSFDIITKLKRMENHKEATLSPSIIQETLEGLQKSYDPVFGGFSKAPKFPTPHQILFALSSDNLDDQQMGLTTLEHMAKGGIYDHIGGGFSRYSVDQKWLIPHFEKMLYDNGLLLDLYAKAFDMIGEEAYKVVIEETISFMKNELMNPEGGFYSAYDADSEGVEGKYYRFTIDEVKKVLGDDKANKFIEAYGLSEHGNFEGFNIPNLIGESMDIMLDQELIDIRRELKTYRDQRVKPALDDKILSMSNGFAIHGLCEVYRYLNNEEALNLAIDAYYYVNKYMIKEDVLLASIRNDKGNVEGMIDDYASFIRSALSLYDVTQEEKYLTDALKLMKKTIELFYDEEHGGFFVGSKENKALIYNPKEIYDGATPSGNSVMAMNLLKCYLITEEPMYKEFLDIMVDSFSHHLNNYKQHASYLMSVVKILAQGSKELKVYLPDKTNRKAVLKWMLKEGKSYTITKLVIDESMCLDGQVTVYKCENNSCKQPVVLDL